jgi:2-polyprenyl-3-methyl-5-hydroxy-6-metoxy-1,4-benzoquinol methylase
MTAGHQRAIRVPQTALAAAAHTIADPALRDTNATPSYLHANPLIRWLFWKRLDVVASLLAAQRREYDAGLDFGCGLGVLLPTLTGMTRQVYATDLLPAPAHHLVSELQLRNVTFVDPAAIPDVLPPLDFVVSTDVLEHVDPLDATLAALVSALKDDGILVISGPTESGIYKLGRMLAGFGGKGDYHLTNIHDIHARLIDPRMGLRVNARRVLPLPGIVEAFHIYCYARVPS